MCESDIKYEDLASFVEDLKQHQMIVVYTIFRALKENKNITSSQDFFDFYSDVETAFKNL